ncbi:hypothetical protein [Bradyrhizobium sp.]|uniref:hypothetical protein n=1 Tax=Bradyrhizobium sp. TaxID=376 RepID=UPI002388EA92|nr:hypothetical protein [Bradyrhizobium sp.]MDE1935162.1 hypothetical protein [Bradyrhizobium sp.]
MTKLGVMAAAVSLLLAGPAAAYAAHHGTHAVRHSYNHHSKWHAHRVYPRAYAAGGPNYPVENAVRWGYSQGYQHYPSGWGGLYGDGRYPGNVISNRPYPRWW